MDFSQFLGVHFYICAKTFFSPYNRLEKKNFFLVSEAVEAETRCFSLRILLKIRLSVRYLMLSRQNNDLSSQQETVEATWGCESAAAFLGCCCSWVKRVSLRSIFELRHSALVTEIAHLSGRQCWGFFGPKFSQTLKVKFVRTSWRNLICSSRVLKLRSSLEH